MFIYDTASTLYTSHLSVEKEDQRGSKRAGATTSRRKKKSRELNKQLKGKEERLDSLNCDGKLDLCCVYYGCVGPNCCSGYWAVWNEKGNLCQNSMHVARKVHEQTVDCSNVGLQCRNSI